MNNYDPRFPKGPMMSSSHSPYRKIPVTRYICSTLAGWTAVVLGLAYFHYLNVQTVTIHYGLTEARAHFSRDLTFRLWATSHQGVYVEIDKNTPPNPYLAHLPERDIQTPSGRRLTLMNPAYIMRQINENFSDIKGAAGHITSLNVLRKENGPDPWEEKALKRFAKGEKEVFELLTENGGAVLRLMRPLVVVESCLKCHGQQGYKVGDIRGGVGVTLPMTRYYEQRDREVISILISYGILWILGLTGILTGSSSLKKRIYERDLSQQELENHSLHLEELVATRPEELLSANKNLKDQHYLLEKSLMELKKAQSLMLQREKMASIGQLAAGVAHEINNPVGFVVSNLNTLGKYVARLTGYIKIQEASIKEESAGELEKLKKEYKIDYISADAKELIEESLEGTSRVSKIVRSLKSFSRIDDEAEYQPANLNECLETTLNIVWNELKYKAQVSKNLGELPLTRCHPSQLNQVFMNLLINSSQAIEKDGKIDIKSWHGDNLIHISVADNGKGIAKEHMSRLFEPFFTTKEVGQGTGLGLSIAYEIVHKHNGTISVESEIGVGTTFTLAIPVVA